MSNVFSSSSPPNHSIFIGAKEDASSLQFLHSSNIKHVINATPPREKDTSSGIQNFFEGAQEGIKYLRVPVYDKSTSDLLSHADDVAQFIRVGLYHGSVFVHCKQGVSRSVACVMMYLIREELMTAEEALSAIKKIRAEANPIAAFISQCKEYEGRFAGTRAEKQKELARKREKKERKEKKALKKRAREEKADKEAGGDGGVKKTKKRVTVENQIGPSSIGPSIGPSISPNNS